MSNEIDMGSVRHGGDFVRYVVGRDSRQMAMGVWSVEDEVARESPARFIEVFVESLELDRLGFRHAVPRGRGGRRTIPATC